MGKVEPLTIIDDPSAWLARDFPDPAAYAYHLSPADLAELDAAVASASAAVAGGKEVQVRRVLRSMLQNGYWTVASAQTCQHLPPRSPEPAAAPCTCRRLWRACITRWCLATPA